MDALQFGMKAAEIMLPPSRAANDPAAFSRAVASMTEPDPITGALPQFDASRGGKPLEVPAKPAIPASVNAWANQGSANDPLAVGLPTRQGLKDTWNVTKEMGRGFVRGLHPDVNPVTGAAVGTARFFKNVGELADNANNFFGSGRRMLEEIETKSNQPQTDPAALAAAQSAPKPTMGSYLSGSLASNPLWMLPAAGLGGLGAYGLYKLMSARRDENKKRRRLMAPAAIIH